MFQFHFLKPTLEAQKHWSYKQDQEFQEMHEFKNNTSNFIQHPLDHVRILLLLIHYIHYEEYLRVLPYLYNNIAIEINENTTKWNPWEHNPNLSKFVWWFHSIIALKIISRAGRSLTYLQQYNYRIQLVDAYMLKLYLI